MSRFHLPGIALGSLGLLLLFLPLSVSAQSAHVDAHLDADSLQVGEQATLWMIVEHTFPSEVTFPDTDAGPMLFGDLQVLDRGEPAYEYRRGARIDSVGYTVTTFELDDAQVPELPAWIVQNEDTTIAGSDAFTVPIASVLPADTTTAMQGLMPPASFPHGWRVWTASALGVLALFALIAWIVRRRPWADQLAEDTADPPKSPFDRARKQLDSLQPPNQGSAKPFYVTLTYTLRTYLSERLRIPAHERTSTELVEALRRHPHVPPPAAGRIDAVLELADLAKFADTHPDGSANTRALHETQRAIATIEEAVRAVERPPSPPETAPATAPETS